jgi:HAD superfamily hydrolase (TIGR01509 family)
MLEEVAGILFDVDGTLLDTTYLHVLAWSRAFRDAGHRVEMAAIHALIGMGSDQLLERVLGRPDAAVNEGHSRHYGELSREMRAFDRAPELLRECASRGAQVILATSAKADELDAILDAIGARDALAAVITSGDVERSKPDPQIFEVALERTGLRPAEAVVLGDTVWDIEAARACGLGCVAVTTGGIAREVLSRAGALAVYQNVGQLCGELDRSPLAGFLGRQAA